MKSKIFISLNISPKIKRRLISAIQKWQNLPVRWAREENLHITLVFLGFVVQEAIPEICEKVAKASEKNNIFDIAFEKIEIFPSDRDPHMIALTGEASDELKKLVNDIEKELGISGAQKISFRPHVTLGKIKKFEWQALDAKPLISEKFQAIIAAESVDIMASRFEKKENKYVLIESCPLK